MTGGHVLPDAGERDAAQLQPAIQMQRVQGLPPTPTQRRVLAEAQRKGMVAALPGDRDQVVHLELERRDLLDEARRAGRVHEGGTPPLQPQEIHDQPGDGGLLPLRCGCGLHEIGNARPSVGEDPQVQGRSLHRDLTEAPGPPEDPRQLEVDHQAVEVEERGAVPILQLQALDDGPEGEGIEADGPHHGLAFERAPGLRDDLVASDPGDDEESQHGVEGDGASGEQDPASPATQPSSQHRPSPGMG
jgi:hypothetical protein